RGFGGVEVERDVDIGGFHRRDHHLADHDVGETADRVAVGVQLNSLDGETGGVGEIAFLIDAELAGAAVKRSALGVVQNEQPVALNGEIGGAVGGLDAALNE